MESRAGAKFADAGPTLRRKIITKTSPTAMSGEGLLAAAHATLLKWLQTLSSRRRLASPTRFVATFASFSALTIHTLAATRKP